MTRAFSGSLSEWLFLCRHRGFGARRNSVGTQAPVTVPTAPARKILAVEFLKFGADDRGQIVPIIACGASAPGKSPPTVNAAPRWIRLRAGVEQTVKPA